MGGIRCRIIPTPFLAMSYGSVSMDCPSCGRSLQATTSFCWYCGPAESWQDTAGVAEIGFDGTALDLLGWMLLAIPAILLVVPSAWWCTGVCRWFCRNLRFSDRTEIEFHGKGGEVLA